ncbi:thiol peroxidase (atypical 2-Cys peroxiredoxin) [Paucidesulfovibrio gracilis DSM 16080]|uniref:Thiol peroxidase n=1 Tax=Paucidesulfovibrio gracilis DSM 16080 TaxID=1121449 RepID=A0A1T4WXM9_9BACT|nr:thiol peroxidase [Paucidesulfovibrio gracilis]SKA81897.1 thiol peroxidase (atypical 2-Cys peroxiredoxin) [Paucidesulfovibrio gracilis DSM 16080]
MQERQGLVTIDGNPLTLVGPELRPGDAAPGFTLLDTDMNPKTLEDYRGRPLIISSVPSLDTPVCDMETRRFNREAASLGDGVRVLTVSMDLPFAQSRWCGAAGVDNVVTLSDHKDASFGENWGVLLRELRLLARCVFVVDADAVIRFVHLVPEVTDEPDYDAVLAAVRDVV